jgi:hypothetical protein
MENHSENDAHSFSESKATMQSATIETTGSTQSADIVTSGAPPGAFAPTDERGGDRVEPVMAAQQAPVTFTLSLIDRLESLLERETGSLKGYTITELKELNHRKSQCLLELMRASRSLEGQPQSRVLADRLATLRATVDRNQEALQTHVDAVKEIAEIISGALRDTESDGTYDERKASRG